MNNLKIILAMIGLVAIGFVGGFVVHQKMVEKRMEDIAKEGFRVPLHERMFNLLELTPEQHEKLEPVLLEHHDRMKAIHRDMIIHRAQLFESLNKSLEGELTEVQQEKLKRFLKRQKRFRKFRENGKKPPHGKKRKKRLEAE